MYNIYKSDPTNINPISITDYSLDQNSTSLSLLGKNYPAYGQSIATNFVHLLENFASATPPNNSIQGQLWYDNINNKLMVNDAGGAFWSPVNRVYQQNNEPLDVKTGDVWINTTPGNIQLTIRTDTGSWTQPWPTTTSLTGSFPSDGYLDSSLQPHSIIKETIGSTSSVVAIFATEAFTPLSPDQGFSQLKRGINIPNDAIFNGVSQSTYNLQLTYPRTEAVSVNNFVRNDINQRLAGSLSIAIDSNSLQLGYNNNFILEVVNQYNSKFINSYQSTSTSAVSGQFTFDVQVNGQSTTLLTVDGSNQTVTIGETGNVGQKVKGNLVVTGDVNFIPAGTIMPFAGTVAPLGWLMCDGSTTSTLVHPKLSAAIAGQFGPSVGGVIVLPDLRNYLIPANNTGTTINYIIRY